MLKYPSPSDRFSTWLVWPTAVFAALFIVLTYGGIDQWFAGILFHAEGGRWALRDAPLLNAGFHYLGKSLSTLMWLSVVGALVATRKQGLTQARRALWILAISVAASTLLVSVAKSLTHMDCPWDLIDFGGVKQYVYLLQPDRVNTVAGKCFPAGQASAGYAWVALYFAALVYKPHWRRAGLIFGVAFGVALGFAQQLRGAHFLSHDLTTAWICWVVATVVYHAMAPSAHRALANTLPMSKRQTVI